MNEDPDSSADSVSDGKSLARSIVVQVQSTETIVSKRPRTSSTQCLGSQEDPYPTPTSDTHEPERLKKENAVLRIGLRTLTYFIYDGFPVSSGYREFARVCKVMVETVVDERYPPPHRADMSLSRKCAEFLLAPASSSLIWFVLRTIQMQKLLETTGFGADKGFWQWLKAFWTVTHRIARQALIYRLFFRIGSLKYSLASALGIMCCFFRETIFPDIIHLHLWPKHFSASQGIAAVFRSLIYATAFALPLQKCSKLFRDSPRRRGNVKKLIFALVLAKIQRSVRLYKLVEASQ
ncbi:unnamed protein product [Agarophyton chilense]